jgi:hypothetical protein
VDVVGIVVVGVVGLYVVLRADVLGAEVASRQNRPDAQNFDKWFIRVVGVILVVTAVASLLAGA